MRGFARRAWAGGVILATLVYGEANEIVDTRKYPQQNASGSAENPGGGSRVQDPQPSDDRPVDPREVKPDAPRSGPGGVSEGADASPPSSTVEELQRKLLEMEDRWLRTRADFANSQRASREERDSAIRYANVDILRSWVSAMDDLERSLAIETQSPDAARLREGVQLVYQNMLKAIKDRGVEVLDPRGQRFDPAYHEALVRQPSTDGPPNTVLTVLSKGYRMGDRVIRPARVVVSSAPEKASHSSEDRATAPVQ